MSNAEYSNFLSHRVILLASLRLLPASWLNVVAVLHRRLRHRGSWHHQLLLILLVRVSHVVLPLVVIRLRRVVVLLRLHVSPIVVVTRPDVLAILVVIMPDVHPVSFRSIFVAVVFGLTLHRLLSEMEWVDEVFRCVLG